ncbi:DNA repair protein rad51d [Coemansia sp. RSA 1200]|nr:DNA repair protein rad51d [Coemansia sp. RSA 1200]
MPHLKSAKYIRQWVDGLHLSQSAETEAFPFEQCLAALNGVGVQTDYDLVIRTDVLPETPPFLHRYIKAIRMVVLEHFTSGGQSALDVLDSTSENTGYVDRSPVFIKSGISCLDDLLCGGLRVGQVTELCGKSGSGKTQLAIRFAVSHLVSTNAQSSDSKVYFLQTSTLPIWRVEELLRAELGDSGAANNNTSLQRAMERLIVVDCHTHESLLEFLYKYAAETAYSRRNDESTLSTDLMIIDSIRPLIINASDTYNNRYVLIHAIKTALRSICAGTQNLRSVAIFITNGISQRA